MIDDNVLYINLEPYNYNIEYKKLCISFYNNNKKFFNKNNKKNSDYIKFISLNTYNDKLKYINKNNVKKNIDIIISKQILKILINFLNNKNNKKIKKNIIKKNKTIKIH